MEIDKVIRITDEDYSAVWPHGASNRREYPLAAGRSLLAHATAARDNLPDPNTEHELGLNAQFQEDQYAVTRRRTTLEGIIIPLEALYGPACADDVEQYLRGMTDD